MSRSWTNCTTEERRADKGERRSVAARRKMLTELDQIAAKVHVKDMTPRLRLELAGVEPKDLKAVLEACEVFGGTITGMTRIK